MLLEEVASFGSIDCPFFHQGVAIDHNGVLHDGSKGEWLIGALAKLLNGGDHFHDFSVQSALFLLRSSMDS